MQKRLLIPMGNLVTGSKGGGGTVTAHDPITNEAYALGHRVARWKVGDQMTEARGKTQDGKIVICKQGTAFGTLIFNGLSGIIISCFREPVGQALWTGEPVEGPAELWNTALASGRMEVTILGGGEQLLPMGEGRTCRGYKIITQKPVAFGFSGSPIIQKGKLVGALWARDNRDSDVSFIWGIDKMVEMLRRGVM